MSMTSRAVVVLVARCVDSEVVSLPNRYRSIKFCGMGSVNGGWLLVLGFGWLHLCLWGWMSPICGSSSVRALWSPYSEVCVDLFFFACNVVWLMVSGGASDLCEF